VCFAGKHNKLITVGFSRTAGREYCIWDLANMAEPLVSYSNIDNSSGVLAPFYDEDSDICFLAGKGDGNIRFYEFLPEETPKKMFVYLSQYSSNESGSAYGAAPKRACDVNSNEIMRIYKVTKTQAQPLHFTVPRKSELFQDDIFPPCRSDEPSLSSEEYFGGSNAEPKTKSLEGGFVAKEPKTVEFTKAETQEKELSGDELKKAYDEALKRIAYLEAELKKAQAK
jgi:coronin-1B/1C/6